MFHQSTGNITNGESGGGGNPWDCGTNILGFFIRETFNIQCARHFP